MAIKYKQFSDKFNSLPEEAVFYFSNEISGHLILGLATEYNIDKVYVYNLVFDTVNSEFDFDYLKKEILEIGLSDDSRKNFTQDFIGRILLPIGPYIKIKDIKNELIKIGGDPKLYQEGVNDFLLLIENENFKIIDSFVDLQDKVDIKEERNYALDLFDKHLLEILKSDAYDSTQTLNAGLIFILNTDNNFQSELIQILLNSNAILTPGKLILEDREVLPTVANWLKDFIKVNGSDIFDELKLAEYLSNSANAAKLSKEEKDLLRKLLKLYRNLNFFPESMDKAPIKDWQIIPVEIPEKKSSNFVDTLDEGKNTVDANIDKVPVINKVSEDKLKEPNQLDELEETLSQYNPGTLEHKAVTQEIGRLNKKNKK